MTEDKRKALEETYWAVLSNFFGPSPLAIIEPLEKAAKEVEALNANLTAFNRGLVHVAMNSPKVSHELNASSTGARGAKCFRSLAAV